MDHFGSMLTLRKVMGQEVLLNFDDIEFLPLNRR